MIQCESSQVDLIPVSFIISLFGVNSIKINILCENVSAFFYMYQAKNVVLKICKLKSSWESVAFPKLTQFSHLIFFQYNLVYFDFVRTSNSPKSCVWYHCIKFLFERVWWEFCLILFSVILITPGIHMYCNYLLTTKVTALRSY